MWVKGQTSEWVGHVGKVSLIMAIMKEQVVRVLKSKIFQEICCFAALMALLIAQGMSVQ